uniref:STAGA complex 65 subunit gamma-like n=1 Tax=Hirondellea gigas TaxID=1518452 RepID=A0A2P2I4U1_9CRUS
MNGLKEKHWGEFEDSNDDLWGSHSFVPSDYHELMTPQIYPPTSISLHQPSHQMTSTFQILNGGSCKPDPNVQNTVRCLQHTRHVSHLINRAQTALNSSSSNNSSSNGGNDTPPITLTPCPPLPTDLPLKRTPLGFQNLNFLPPQSTAFTSGNENGHLQEVEQATARKMLRQSVALLLAHAGFVETSESILRTLSDLAHEFLTKFTKTLRNNADNATLLGNYCPFHDVLEQTMQQMHIGGFKDLHTMYKERVQNYEDNVKHTAQQFNNHYNGMLSNYQQQQQQMSWQSSSSNSVPTPGRPYTQMFSTAAGGSINITIGALPGSAGINYPNLTASNSLDDSSNNSDTIVANNLPSSRSNTNITIRTSASAVVGSAGNTVGRAGNAGRGSIGNARGSTVVSNTTGVANNINNTIINLEQELSRQYAPINLQSADADGRNQNSPLATHFTITPRLN